MTKTSGVGSDDQFKNMVEKVIRNKCLHVYFISPNGSITGDWGGYQIIKMEI